MKFFQHERPGRTIVVRLDQGDDILDAIAKAIADYGIKDGYIASGIGTLDYCVMHMVMTTSYPAVEYFARWDDKPLEISSIDGIIADGSPHLHMVVSDNKTAVAGHVEPGCRILYLGEIVIQESIGQPLKRVRNEKGITELVAD